MNCELYYQFGKKKALTFSYDDGQVYDRRLIDIFNKYHLKATFHLNSGTLGTDGYVTKGELQTLYKDHEISCHSVTHPHLTHLSRQQLVEEIWEDRRELERLSGYPIRGMSYPFGEYDDACIKSLEVLGIEYSRTVNSTDNFLFPSNFLEWNPTCHHNGDIMDKLNAFKNQSSWARLPLFYIWGHSYEFERQNNWSLIEEFCEAVAFDTEVWYATNIEIKDYISAVRSLVFDVNQTIVYNPTAISVWLRAGENILEVKPGKTMIL
ncbi:MAG: polysaccharide deacetylase family protein [Ruminiclostridium sp.]